MKRNTRARMMALCMFALVMVAPVQALADTTGGIGGKPVNTDPKNPRTESIFIHTIERGKSQSDAVAVVNNSDKKDIIDLYVVDSQVSNTGAFTCAQRVDEAKDIGAWVTLSKKQVTLEPGKKEIVPFTITVPANADVGEHNGCVVFQSTLDKGEVKGNVRIRTRQAIRLVTTIPGQLKKEVSIDKYTFTNKDGLQTYKLMLSNSGNVSADVEAGVRLKTLLGQEVYKNGGEYPILSNKRLQLIYTNQRSTFPQKGANYTFALAFYELFGGWYKTDASVTYDTRPGSFGLADSDNLVTKNSGEEYVYVAPSQTGTIVLGALAAIVVGAVAAIWFTRRSLKRLLSGWETIEVQIDEDVVTIAKYYGVNWKKLAKVNKIKAPYIVREGQEIQVPIKRVAPKPVTPVAPSIPQPVESVPEVTVTKPKTKAKSKAKKPVKRAPKKK